MNDAKDTQGRDRQTDTHWRMIDCYFLKLEPYWNVILLGSLAVEILRPEQAAETHYNCNLKARTRSPSFAWPPRPHILPGIIVVDGWTLFHPTRIKIQEHPCALNLQTHEETDS